MRLLIGCAALFALTSCNQPAEEAASEPEAPRSLMQQVRALSPDQQPVFAWQQLTAYQQAHPEAQPACTSIRRAESRGAVPQNVAPDSIYAPFAGADVFAIQCGPQLTTVRDDPREHWLVVFAPDAMAPIVVNCAGERGIDRCAVRAIPTAETP